MTRRLAPVLGLLCFLATCQAWGQLRHKPQRVIPGRQDWRRVELRRFGLQRPTGKRTRRVAATTVLTEHPSSLRLLRKQFGRLKRVMRSRTMRRYPNKLLRHIEQPLMTPTKQVREFENLALRRGVATGKMIDFEGKPMPPSVISRYVDAIERAGMRPGIEGDRFLLLRLPGAKERSARDRKLRSDVFESIVDTNLKRVVAGKGLPVDRLIVPNTKNVGQMLEVHDTYDKVASTAVARAVRTGKVRPADRARVLERLRQIQVVPLVEDADTVMNAHKMVGDYLGHYKRRYKSQPRQMVVFVAGSDLNREVGPVAGQISRTVMRSRLAKLQRRLPAVDLIPWVGIGSGPMRSGVGRFPEKASMLHPGMTFTVQPDQLDQKGLERTVAAMGRAAFRARPRKMSVGQEKRLIALGAAFADIHAQISLRSALSTIRIKNLLTPLKQRGRKATAADLIYEKQGELYLRAVQPREKRDGAVYGRTLDVSGYGRQVPDSYPKQRKAIERRQKTIDRLWPKGLADTRAIGGAFARYVQGHALTTVSGLGLALRRSEATLGKREVNRLRSFITFLVQNDGFVLTRDRALVRRRIEVLQPGLNPKQVNRWVKRYFTDIACLEHYLAQPLDKLVSKRDRARYERMARKLYKNPHFVSYMSGQDIRLRDWRKIMDAVVPLLSNPGWNRVG